MPDRDFWTLLADDFCPVNFRSVTDLGFVLATAPLAGTQLLGSKWFSAEVLSMSY